MQAHRKHHSKSCDTPVSLCIPVPAAHCRVSDCNTSRSLCVDVDQKSAHYNACPVEVSQTPLNIKIIQEKPCFKAPKFGCKINPKERCVKAGKAHVQGPNILVKRQRVNVDLVCPSEQQCKMSYSIGCCPIVIHVPAPKIVYCPGKVCRERGGPIVTHKHHKRPCKPHKKPCKPHKKTCHKGRK